MTYQVVGRSAASRYLSADISEGGIRVYTREKAEPGDRIELTVDLAGTKLTAKAEVRWCRPAAEMELSTEYEYVVGLEFVEMAKYCSELLVGYIKERLISRQ